jgi:high affinity Mn2+ porin
VIGGCALLAFLASDAARAAPRVVYDWSGYYIGVHFGYGGGGFGPNTNPILGQALLLPPSVTGFIGGFQGGYNYHAANNWVLGVEADISVGSPIDRDSTAVTPFNTTVEFFSSARGRIGYAFGPWLPYVTGGVAFAKTRIDVNNAAGNVITSRFQNHIGWTAGGGIEAALFDNWTAKVEYNYFDFGARTYPLEGLGVTPVTVDPRLHALKLGLNYRIGDVAASRPFLPSFHPSADDWSLHGQSTFIAQGYPSFRSPYQGTNSLSGQTQIRETTTATAFVGRKLWDGGEIYFNPELAQGFGLNTTLGLGGFANGEAQKAGAEYPRVRAQRYFVRQTFGFGGGEEIVEDGPNQIAGKRDIDRLTLTLGRIAIGDIFDANSYAHDPRADFMNWAMWSAAAYDFPADLPGFTRGAVAEFNRKDWAIRAGLFQVPEGPNNDVLKFKTGGALVEFEERHQIAGRPGKLRIGLFANRGLAGNYREAIATAAVNPTLDINDVMASIRRLNDKYGFYVNAEQEIADNIGMFARASMNDGRNEILSFTDIDRSVSGGFSFKGARWGRADDTFGIGAAVNGLSPAHRDFLAAGGLGLLIGDGALRYRPETIFETYYLIGLAKGATLTLDYQFIANPAYNADRGPVSLFAARAHVEY